MRSKEFILSEVKTKTSLNYSLLGTCSNLLQCYADLNPSAFFCPAGN